MERELTAEEIALEVLPIIVEIDFTRGHKANAQDAFAYADAFLAESKRRKEEKVH